MPDKPGSVNRYYSDNGRYELSITYGEHFHTWSLKEEDRELWKETLTQESGSAAVSDNGETITLPLWGWRDEDGSSGIAVFNKQGKPVKEILFSGNLPDRGDLRWVRDTRISPDGSCIAIGENRKEHAAITLFNAESGLVIWEKSTGFPEVVQVKVSEKGKYTLVATRQESGSDMQFQLLDNNGRMIWQRMIRKNFSGEVNNYLKFSSNLSEFEIYNLKAGRYISDRLPETGT